jgi:hypothetical protein
MPSRADLDFGPQWQKLRKYKPTSILVVCSLHATVFHGVAHIPEHKYREGRHALPLFGTKRFVKWLPRLSELIQIS